MRTRSRALIRLAAIAFVTASLTAAPRQAVDPVAQVLAGIQAAAQTHRVDAFRQFADASLDDLQQLGFEITVFGDDVTNVAVRERDREAVSGGSRVLVEILVDRKGSGQISTWQLVFTDRTPPTITAIKQVSAISGLRRLELDTRTAFAVNNFKFTATDFQLSMSSGVAFVGRTEEGVSAIVLRGRGAMAFEPFDPVERHQLVRFNNRPSLEDEVGAAFIRINPAEYQTRVSDGSLTPIEARPDDIKNARALFDQWSHRSYNIALGDLSTEQWSLLPPVGDALADFHSKKRGWLTYARSGGQQEDVALFNRAERKNISVYASPAKLATRGRFYSEDVERAYDVEHYDIDTRFVNPVRHQLAGRATIRLKLLRHDVGTITLRLADELRVSSVTSTNFGRLLQLRIVNQDSVLISLPDLQPAGTEITLTVTYEGRLDPQSLTRDAATAPGTAQTTQDNPILPEPSYLYSVNSYWYPQAVVTDYATAKLTVTVPEDYEAFASGTATSEALNGADRTLTFVADVPARYLSAIVTRMAPLPRTTITTDAGDTVTIDARASPRGAGGARTLTDRVADMMKFYASVAGGVPYPSLGVLALEADLPGGHSPPYFAAINQPTPTTIFSWRNDPIAFDNQVPDFFLAHEIAHQWWGQAIGTKNYHEQWLSEGLAQYFAYLYVGNDRGPGVQRSILERMRDSVRKFDDSGPIWLGYRLGHAVGDGTNYRAIVYNKSVVVLDLLRQFIGDEAFSAGLRRFYRENQYRKAGTDDLQAAFEAEAKEPLNQFFDRWVLDSGLPGLKLTSVVETGGQAALVRIEQSGPIFDVPARIELSYEDSPTEYVTVKVKSALTEVRLPLHGRLRKNGIRLLDIL
jgi:hypothetical protein